MVDVKFLVMLCMLFCNCNADVEDVLLKIIGGSHCTIKDFPYLGCLMYKDFPRCGAALISYKHLVTAAHCTRNVSPCSLTVRLGSTYNSYGGKVFEVVKITPHPEYNTTTKEHDISVIELNQTVSSNDAHPIGIADYRTECVVPGVYAQIMGWGTVAAGSEIGSKILKCTRVPLISREKCQNAYNTIKRNITKNMLCAGDLHHGGKDTCQGDSGGPLVCDDVIIGIVSFGKSCGSSKYPGVYVRIQNYLHFIYNAIGIRV